MELRAARREEAIDAGQAVERAKVEGKKMRDIRFLENLHRQAWSRFYAIDNLIPRGENA
jgi:hypothetical protein